MLVHNKDKHMDLLEVFCEQTSQLTTSARGAGLKAERWTKEDFDLSQPAGCQAAMKRLRELRPKRLWLSPPCGPFSSMQNVNQRTPEQIKTLIQKRELGFRMWQSCIRLAWLQVELGGSFLYWTTTKMYELETTGLKDPIPAGPTIILLHTRPML